VSDAAAAKQGVVVRPRRQERASREESTVRDTVGLLRERPELAVFLGIVAILGFRLRPSPGA
jgi:hypothetical protein